MLGYELEPVLEGEVWGGLAKAGDVEWVDLGCTWMAPGDGFAKGVSQELPVRQEGVSKDCSHCQW